MAHLLFIDDEQSICWGLTKLAQRLGHSSAAVGSAELGLESAARTPPDAIVMDVRLPGMTGLEAIEHLHAQKPEVPVVIITAYGDLETAVEAVRRGAFEYLVKPFDLQLAERTITRALTAAKSREAAAGTVTGTAPDDRSESGTERLVGKSVPMQGVFKQIALVAPSTACVHLRGESGTGKELVARAIHRYSRRADGPFIPVNLAALNPSLAESELFGHVRGAFTGAEGSRKGLLEQADGGTIFLDEVADIPMSLQVKLLRTLEHGEIWPVGGDAPRHADFRLISATHQDLRQRVADDEFRHDLYFRLVTFELTLPPLRDRIEDIPLLARHFLDWLTAQSSSPRSSLERETLVELERRPWFGNVRELRNAIEHALVLARGGPIEPGHLPPAALPSLAAAASNLDGGLKPLIEAWGRSQMNSATDGAELYQQFLSLTEPSLFKIVLDHHRGQVAAAARVLGLHRTTLKKKLDEYGIHGKDEA
ncbi:MAG: sigma-54-dependent Fis family transcriptional regulator [Planctomycetes bacterium]|nr:sigma-54-dependent Fis family transcriptional regulator [Planctomycetota bacterium]